MPMLPSESEHPYLPPELEREIFETAAVQYPNTIPALFLVSHRVYDWVGKIKYRTIFPRRETYSSPKFDPTCSPMELLEAIDSKQKTASFFSSRVKQLFLQDLNHANLVAILSECNKIDSLVLLNPLPSPGQFFSLAELWVIHPIKLGLRFNEVMKAMDLEIIPQPIHPVFASVTHLDLYDDRHRNDLADQLALLPTLTHLSIWTGSRSSAEMSAILVKCGSLQALVDMHGGFIDENETHPTFHENESSACTDDLRFVSVALDEDMHLADWIIGTQGGIDFWAQADRFIAKRRRGEIQPSTRYWIQESDGI
ncbi:hypothetical protein R3P38DRAFT_2603139 [Favolaschia claudopus]|uniref:F-box domain-containing protein n=1 Tax=Favolaschia claudopus TaxID=2862362 RepID=A0AAW0DJC6_9AGAR